jgi:hypothetical protein
MKYKSIVSYPFSEKNMMFLLKQHCVSLGNNKFEASFEEIKKILVIATKLETVLIENAKDLNKLYSIINNENTQEEQNQYCEPVDHEAPVIRKAKRPIDQINKDTGEIIKTFESIDNAIEYILSTKIVVNQFYSIVRELEENSIVKIEDTYILVDELMLLN